MSASVSTQSFYVNCMPIIPADPVIGSFDAAYDNTAGASAATATVTDSTLQFDDGTGTLMDWGFSVSPTSSGSVAAGQSSVVTHSKVSASGSGASAPCNYCNGRGSWKLSVTWDIGGQSVQDTVDLGAVNCVF